MAKIKKIYFNLNSVLADFDARIRELDPDTKPRARKLLTKEEDEAIWQLIQKNQDVFYKKIPPIEEAIEIFQKIYNRYPGKVEIVTKLPRQDRGLLNVKRDVTQWVEKNIQSVLGDNNKVVIHFVEGDDKKNLCDGPDCILIDDYTKSVEEWTSWGGTAYEFKGYRGLNSMLQKSNIITREVSETNQCIADRIRMRRDQLDMNQSELAIAVDVSSAAVSGWENGKGIELDSLIKVAKQLQTTVGYLLGEHNHPDLSFGKNAGLNASEKAGTGEEMVMLTKAELNQMLYGLSESEKKTQEVLSKLSKYMGNEM